MCHHCEIQAYALQLVLVLVLNSLQYTLPVVITSSKRISGHVITVTQYTKDDCDLCGLKNFNYQYFSSFFTPCQRIKAA